jgi:hypothetical protein
MLADSIETPLLSIDLEFTVGVAIIDKLCLYPLVPDSRARCFISLMCTAFKLVASTLA